ncbi:MAG: tRNA pseudouridine(55) synthase TruB [Candidatus Peregrinibacteria bacterium]
MRHGFLFIDKPVGLTSHDCVARVRGALSERDIGHLGTLDPAATGLLVLAVGAKALKIIELFSGLTKEYDASIRFGAVSTTYDAEGVIETVAPRPGWTVPPVETVRDILAGRFLGTIDQIPPIYSAVHVGGERAYRKARRALNQSGALGSGQGRALNMPVRSIEIHALDILSYEYPSLSLRVACGSGTYIRSLAHDLGQVLRAGAYLAGLRRSRVGEWSVNDAVTLEHVCWAKVVPLRTILAERPRLDLLSCEIEDLRFGRDIARHIGAETIGWFEDLPVAVLVPSERGAHARKVL